MATKARANPVATTLDLGGAVAAGGSKALYRDGGDTKACVARSPGGWPLPARAPAWSVPLTRAARSSPPTHHAARLCRPFCCGPLAPARPVSASPRATALWKAPLTCVCGRRASAAAAFSAGSELAGIDAFKKLCAQSGEHSA